MDIPVVLGDVRVSDTYEGDFESRRVLEWTMTFTMKGYLFGPTPVRSAFRFCNSKRSLLASDVALIKVATTS